MSYALSSNCSDSYCPTRIGKFLLLFSPKQETGTLLMAKGEREREREGQENRRFVGNRSTVLQRKNRVPEFHDTVRLKSGRARNPAFYDLRSGARAFARVLNFTIAPNYQVYPAGIA